MKHDISVSDVEALIILSALNDWELTCLEHENLIDAEICNKIRENILCVVREDLREYE